MALIVVAPSGILVIGFWIACLAAFMSRANPLEPNLLIMMGGIVVVVIMALAAIVRIGRTDGG